MNQQSQNRTGDSDRAEAATPWVRPALSRFRAGAAEFGDISSADGQPGFS